MFSRTHLEQRERAHWAKFINRTDTRLLEVPSYCASLERDADAAMCEQYFFSLTATHGSAVRA
eukprot:284986-Pleurochrysis_carterae.AAC.1